MSWVEVRMGSRIRWGDAIEIARIQQEGMTPMPSDKRLKWYQNEDGIWVARLGDLRRWLKDGEAEFGEWFREKTRGQRKFRPMILGLPSPTPKGSLDAYEATEPAMHFLFPAKRLARALADLDLAKAAAVTDIPTEDPPDVAALELKAPDSFEPVAVATEEFIRERVTDHKKAPTNQDREPRKWQRQRIEQIVLAAKHSDRALVYACPAAGKTYFGLLCYATINARLNRDSPLIIVTPRLEIKAGWINEAKSMGLVLIPADDGRPFLPNQSDMFADGYVLTYQQAVSLQVTLRSFCELHKPTVLLDEVHHTSGDIAARSGNIWGRAIEDAFADATFKLAMTGTPFRSGVNPISFVDYDPHGRVVPTVSYTYEEAIRDRVCRPLEFASWGADFIQKRGDGSGVELIDFRTELSEDDSSDRLIAAVSDTQQYLPEVLRSAHENLLSVRREAGRERAGGLVVTMSRSHAEAVGKLLAGVTGQKPTIVYYGQGDSQIRIKQFRESDDYWIIGINMLSEGVDIPRLSVGVYCTNIISELYFRQFCGRVIRRTGETGPEYAYVYLPAAAELEANALKVLEEVVHALDNDTSARRESFRSGPNGIRELSIKVQSVSEIRKIVNGNAIPLDWLRHHSDALQRAKENYPDASISKMDLAVFLVRIGWLPPFEEQAA